MSEHLQIKPVVDAAAQDYRLSHLERGDSYDAVLAGVPFDAYMAELERNHLCKIVPMLFQEKRPRYLDFACGTARVTSIVAPLCAEAVGIDVSSGMLEQASRKCPTVRFVEADITNDISKVESEVGTFDLITAFRFFGNAQHELRIAALRGLRRLLRPGGYLILNSHRNPHSIAAMLHRATGGDPSGMDLHFLKLKALLRDCGFEITRTQPIGAWMYRFGLQSSAHDSAHAQRLERIFGSSLLTALAPDAIVVARGRS